MKNSHLIQIDFLFLDEVNQDFQFADEKVHQPSNLRTSNLLFELESWCSQSLNQDLKS